MILFAFFTNAGVPALGLAPTIDVWDSAANHPINAQAMAEIAGGWYQYNWPAYDNTADYVIRADGGAGLANFERYVFGSNECDSSVVASQTSIETLVNDELGISGQNVVWTAMTHDANHNLTAATITQYTDNTLITIRKQWTLTATYNAASELTSYNLVEV